MIALSILLCRSASLRIVGYTHGSFQNKIRLIVIYEWLQSNIGLLYVYILLYYYICTILHTIFLCGASETISDFDIIAKVSTQTLILLHDCETVRERSVSESKNKPAPVHSFNYHRNQTNLIEPSMIDTKPNVIKF